jgi:transcriptional regulator with XRE-family HTH domain
VACLAFFVLSCGMRPPANSLKHLQERLSKNLRQIRRSMNLTQDELAARAGLDARHLQKIEAAQVNATLKTVAVLAASLNIDPAELLRAQ